MLQGGQQRRINEPRLQVIKEGSNNKEENRPGDQRVWKNTIINVNTANLMNAARHISKAGSDVNFMSLEDWTFQQTSLESTRIKSLWWYSLKLTVRR